METTVKSRPKLERNGKRSVSQAANCAASLPPQDMPELPKGVCVKSEILRPRYDNLEEWAQNPRHVLVTRKGRVFVGRGEKRHVFAYKQSPWANPFSLKEYSLDESLELYKQHLESLLKEKHNGDAFLKLRDAEEIGCFCKPTEQCHRNVILHKLVELISEESNAQKRRKVDTWKEGVQ